MRGVRHLQPGPDPGRGQGRVDRTRPPPRREGTGVITKVLLTSIIDNTAPGPDDEQARMILATTAGDILDLGIVVDLEQTDQVPSKTLDGASTDIDTLVQRLRVVSQE